MALEKVVTYEQQVYHASSVHVRIRTGIVEDGKEISFSYNRKVIMCDDDYSDHDSQTKSVCDAVFTDEVKATQEAFLQDQRDKGIAPLGR